MRARVAAPRPRLRILGAVEVVDDGETRRVRSRAQRSMLTVLLLEANRTVPSDRLVDEVWGEELPDDPPAALRTQVSRLRRVLPSCAELVTEPRGYRLVVDADEVDAWRFRRLVAAADDRTDREALDLLDAALSLWHDDPLAEFADRPFAQVEQRRLEDLHDRTLERRASLLLDAGRAADAAAVAAALLEVRPERERARAVLMEALTRLGRHTDALAAYESWRRALAERGLEPSPALREAEARVLRHDADRVGSPVGPARGTAVAGRVLRPVSTFVGRGTDVLGVTELIRRCRLVTLWGPGGVGKTRLATEVAGVLDDGRHDGIHLCDLSALASGSDVVRAIASSVGVQERAGRSLEAQLVEALGARRLLVVLDGCEHVLEAAARVAQRLVTSTSAVHVLATSRERLGVDGEHLWEVAPLDADGAGSPAVQLFVDRARATSPSFDPSADDREVIADLCRRLDGLPLAVELAAARVRGFSLHELLSTLERRPDVLRGGAGLPPRHRSLRAVIDWSYSLLTADEQRVLDGLAVLCGPFTLDTAGDVVADEDLDPDEVTLAVLSLLDRSLLVRRLAGGTTRYLMLDTVRRFGLDRLDERGRLDAAAERHAGWALTLAERAAPGLVGPDEASWASAITDSVAELRAAHRWLVGHDPERALRLTVALRPYAHWRGHSEILRWADVAVAAASGIDSPLLAEAMLASSTGAWQRGDLAGARTTADAIMALGGSPEARRPALEASADVALHLGDLARAEAEFREASVLAAEAGDGLQAAWDLGSAAVSAGYAGDTDRALQLATRTIEVAETCGSPTARALAHFAMGEVLATDDPSAAVAHLHRSIELASVADSRIVTGLAEVALAASLGRQHDVGAALGHCRSAIVRWHRAGAWTPLWVTMRTVVALLARVGAEDDAAVLLGATRAARTGPPAFGPDAVRLRDLEQRLRDALGGRRFAELIAHGRSMSDIEATGHAVDALLRASDRPGAHAEAPAGRT